VITKLLDSSKMDYLGRKIPQFDILKSYNLLQTCNIRSSYCMQCSCQHNYQKRT